jgi:ferrous iron transport protein A
MNKEISLAMMKKGQRGTVSTITGGRTFRLKLESMGIHPGSKVAKVSNLFHKGPVILHVGGTEVALGYNMANRIMITIPTRGKRS